VSLRAGSDLKVYIGRRHLQLPEEDFGHIEVVMLTGVNHELIYIWISSKCPKNRRDLHVIGTCTNDVADLHEYLLTKVMGQQAGTNSIPGFGSGHIAF
jgi:hypothetical protein